MNIEKAGEAEPKRLWDEYKLTQEKIDKIGEFQFKVKGWSATLLGAVLYGGARISQVTAALLSGLAIAFIFHISEKRQRDLSKALGERAFDLERAFQSFPPIANARFWDAVVNRTPNLRYAPAIAHTLGRRGLSGPLVGRSNDVFYWAQYILLVVLLMAHLTNFSIKTVAGPKDPASRHYLTFGPYQVIIYKSR